MTDSDPVGGIGGLWPITIDWLVIVGDWTQLLLIRHY